MIFHRQMMIYQHARCDYGSMLKVVDEGMKNVTAAIRAKGLWENGLMIVSADNGGVMAGNNWPWRGEKLTAWEGTTVCFLLQLIDLKNP